MKPRDLARLLVLFLLPTGCFSFSSFQSARMVDPGSSRCTLSLAQNGFQVNDGPEEKWILFEVQNRIGLSPGVDGAIHASVVRRSDGWAGLLIGLDGRVSIWRDHLAFAVPAQVFLGDFSLFTPEFSPGVVGTMRLSKGIEVTGSVHDIIALRDPQWTTFTYSFGFGWQPTVHPWVVRPEWGWMRAPGRKVSSQFGVGVEFSSVVP